MIRLAASRPVLVVCTLCLLVGTARAEPPAPFEDRVKILETEMRRGPAADLEPFLGPDAPELSRGYAIRALGRIGDRAGAPEILARLLAEPTASLGSILHAAGLAQSKTLFEPIAAHLASEDPAVRAAAAEALGWTGADGVAERLAPLLLDTEASVRAGALAGLARSRAEGLLERVCRFLDDPDAHVREEAAFAAWLLASRRRQEATERDPAWNGDPELARTFLPLLAARQPERRMAGIRPLGSLLPDALEDETWSPVLALADDADPRVVQDFVWRILTPRTGPRVVGALAALLRHGNPEVRRLAAEALGASDVPVAAEMLLEQMSLEADVRVRDAIAVAFTRAGRVGAWKTLRSLGPRPADPVLRQVNDVRAMLGSESPDGLAAALHWLDPDGPAANTVHAAAFIEAASALEGREDPRVEAWIRRMLGSEWPDPFVRAAVVSLVGARADAALIGLVAPMATEDVDPEVGRALADALGKLGAVEGADRASAKGALLVLADHPSAFVRAAARDALEALGETPPADERPPNDWDGIPRPEGFPLPGTGERLREPEILRFADEVYAAALEAEPRMLRVVFETSAGPFGVELDFDAAPVHATSLVAAAASGLLDGTRWHRVVPNFVIQGGDPYGHGAGNGGWTVPDEITRLPFLRGALGMPKSVKDDGGCQVFVMHTAYRPLDGRYTCYGRVVEGMDAVDRIRVGDHIVKARVEWVTGEPR